jgi:hypothetical protein
MFVLLNLLHGFAGRTEHPRGLRALAEGPAGRELGRGTMGLDNMGLGNQDDEREKSRKPPNFLQVRNRDSRQRIIQEKR